MLKLKGSPKDYMPFFWSNTIWYILLSCTSIISMVFVLKKSKHRKFTIAFTFAMLGLAFLIESLLVVSFNSYNYYPKLVVDDLFQDTVLGNYFSQFSFSSTLALAIVYKLSYKWSFLFAGIYYLIEELFVHLGIYQQYWYTSIYTTIGFIFSFWFVKIWYNKIISSSKHYIYYTTLFLSVMAATASIMLLPLKLLKIQVFSVNFYGDFSKNHTTTGLIYGFFLINLLINLYKWKLHWAWKGIAFAILFIIQYAFYKSGIIYYKNGWFFIITLIDLFGIYLWIAVFDSFLSKRSTVQ